MSLDERFERDILFLQQNLIPIEKSGEKVDKLNYEGNDSELLTDSKVQRLAEALLVND
jgi:hypothetical protein